MGIVRTHQFRRAFDGGPPPPGSDDDRDRGLGAGDGELAAATRGDERDRVSPVRMGNHAGVDDRGVRTVVGAKGDDDTQTVVEGDQLCEGGEVHGPILADDHGPCGLGGQVPKTVDQSFFMLITVQPAAAACASASSAPAV